jgi:hypothetical protein
MSRPKSHLKAVEDKDEEQRWGLRFLSDQKIAKRYDVSVATVLRWRREGKFPPAITLVPNGPNRTSIEVILAHETARAEASLSEAPSSTSFTSEDAHIRSGKSTKRPTRHLEEA